MQAVGYNGTKFASFEKEIEAPQGRDLMVEIQAISINPIDAKVKQTVAKDAHPKILGYDAAGVVTSISDQASLFKVGDTVFYSGDMTRDGSNATHQLVDERIVGSKPKTLNFAESAALPLTSITAWEALFDRLKITPADKGKTLLLIGAAGGVGSMAIQLAKQIIGINVIATASRDESKDWCKQMGADVVIDHHNLVTQFKDDNLTLPDFILCMGDPDEYFETMAELIAPQGLICALSSSGESYDMNLLKSKSAGFVWEFMFARTLFKTDDMIQQHKILNKVANLVDSGKITTTATHQLSPINLENIIKAHTIIEKREMIGKLVVAN